MAGHSESTTSHCRALFDIALQAYEKNTGITLGQHPLTLQLQNCHSVESIASFLQDQIPSSSDSGGNDRIMASIRSTISILSNLSAASALAWANDMTFSPENAIHAGLAILLAAAKRVDSNNDILVELLESIETFLKRLAIYTQIPTTSLDEMVVKIMMELLSTIALATKGFETERSTSLIKKTFWREGRRSSTAEA